MTTIAATSPRTSNFSATIPGRIVFALAATLVVALAAHVSIPLWFTPVPLTLQPLAVLGVGLALGPMDGFLAMLAYLAEGAAGLPGFSPAGTGDLLQILGPTGGFLMAYPVVAALAGGITRALSSRTAKFAAALLGCTVATTFLFLSGASWFMHYTHHSLYATWIGAIAPFLPGEAIKVLAAAGIYSTLTRTKRA